MFVAADASPATAEPAPLLALETPTHSPIPSTVTSSAVVEFLLRLHGLAVQEVSVAPGSVTWLFSCSAAAAEKLLQPKEIEVAEVSLLLMVHDPSRECPVPSTMKPYQAVMTLAALLALTCAYTLLIDVVFSVTSHSDAML